MTNQRASYKGGYAPQSLLPRCGLILHAITIARHNGLRHHVGVVPRGGGDVATMVWPQARRLPRGIAFVYARHRRDVADHALVQEGEGRSMSIVFIVFRGYIISPRDSN